MAVPLSAINTASLLAEWPLTVAVTAYFPDVLLVPFTKEVYATLDKVDRDLYVRLLTCEDQDMFGWFMERAESEDPELQRMVRMILDRVQPRYATFARWVRPPG